MELLGAAQLLTTTAASVFQLRDLSLKACLSHTIKAVKVISQKGRIATAHGQ